jgi:hypothetical protein
VKRVIVVLLGTVCIPVLAVSYCSIYDNNLADGIRQIIPGKPRSEIVKRLGSPSWDDVCFVQKNNIYGDALPGLKVKCTRELGYRGAFGGLPDGTYYLVWFDDSDKVIRTGEIHSP